MYFLLNNLASSELFITFYRSAQIKAAVRVNAEKLLFNWQLGRDLVMKRAEERWGAGIVELVSLDLQAEFPDDKGFSARNLWDIKKWYVYYTTVEAKEKLQQFVAEIPRGMNKEEKLQQVGLHSWDVRKRF